MTGVASTGLQLVAIGGTIEGSLDGAGWTNLGTPQLSLAAVAWGNGELVAVGSSGTILRSRCDALPSPTLELETPVDGTRTFASRRTAIPSARADGVRSLNLAVAMFEP